MSPHDLLLPALGFVTGLLLGAVGSGGSILALPAFVYAAGLPVKSAIATSLAVVGATSLIGALLARRRCFTHGCPGQEVDTRVALLFALGGICGAFAGARLSGLLADTSQMLLFAGVMLGAAVAMFRRTNDDSPFPTARSERPVWLVPGLGLGVGLLTGVVGVGGGFLIVPALTLLAGVSVKRAAATSLWIIAANSATGMFGYLDHVQIAWGAAGLFLAVSIVGLIFGLHIARTAKSQGLQVAFAVFLVLVGGYTVIQTVVRQGRPSTRSSRQDGVQERRYEAGHDTGRCVCSC